MRCLSVDTQVDYFLQSLHQGRRRAVNGAKPDSIDFLPSVLVTQQGLLTTLHEANRRGTHYQSICFSAHGNNGVISDDDPPGHLLSRDDPDDVFSIICSGRWIYVMACDVGADGLFVEKIMKSNAHGLVAFTNKPQWDSYDEFDLWKPIDAMFMRAAATNPSVQRFQQSWSYIVKGYKKKYSNSTDSEKEVINRILNTIENMIIQGQ